MAATRDWGCSCGGYSLLRILTLLTELSRWMCLFGMLCSNHMLQITENLIDKQSWSGLFAEAYYRTFTDKNIVSGLRETGIYTNYPKAIPVKTFEPSKPFDKLLVTDQELSLDIVQLQPDMFMRLVTDESHHTSDQWSKVMAVYHDRIHMHNLITNCRAKHNMYWLYRQKSPRCL